MLDVILITAAATAACYRALLAFSKTGASGGMRDKLRGVLGGGGPGAVPK